MKTQCSQNLKKNSKNKILNVKQISGCQRLDIVEGEEEMGRRKVGVVIKGQHEEFLWYWNCSVSWLGW